MYVYMYTRAVCLRARVFAVCVYTLRDSAVVASVSSLSRCLIFSFRALRCHPPTPQSFPLRSFFPLLSCVASSVLPVAPPTASGADYAPLLRWIRARLANLIILYRGASRLFKFKSCACPTMASRTSDIPRRPLTTDDSLSAVCNRVARG